MHIHFTDLVNRLNNDIKNDPKYLIKYYFDNSIEFENYITVISSAKQSVKELQGSYSLEHFSKSFDDLHGYGHEYDEAEELYRYRLVEIDEEFADKINR